MLGFDLETLIPYSEFLGSKSSSAACAINFAACIRFNLSSNLGSRGIPAFMVGGLGVTERTPSSEPSFGKRGFILATNGSLMPKGSPTAPLENLDVDVPILLTEGILVPVPIVPPSIERPFVPMPLVSA